MPNRYIVRLSPLTADVELVARQLADRYDGRLHAVWKHAVKGFWIELSPDAAARLAADGRVFAMEEDARIHPSSAGVQPTGPNGDPAVPFYGADADSRMWHLTRISHREWPRPDGTPASEYFQYRYGNDGSYVENGVTKRVKVYVIDHAVWPGHAEFNGTVISEGFNTFSNPDYQLPGILPFPVLADYTPANSPCRPNVVSANFHGTEVASLVVGTSVGVAKGAEIIPVKVNGCKDGSNPTPTSVAVMISGYDWVRATAVPPAVVSVSTYRHLDSPLTNPPTDLAKCTPGDMNCVTGDDVTALENAINAVVDAGIPVVASANNQFADACYTTPARLSLRGGRRTSSGRASRVITVAGMTRSNLVWDTPDLGEGSNFGQCVDIWAPGTDIPVATALHSTSYGNDLTPVVRTGTSFSAPIVASVVARILASDTSTWRNVPRRDIATNVWDRLRANASLFRPVNLGPASPDRLVYLGGVTFKRGLSSAIVPAGGSVELNVEIAPDEVADPGVTYQWYRGAGVSDPVGSNLPTLTVAGTEAELGTDHEAEYWVRVTRNGAVPAQWADSTLETVRIGSCALPRVVEQPVTQWITGTTATLSARVAAQPGVHWRWRPLDRIGEGAVCENASDPGCSGEILQGQSDPDGITALDLVVTGVPENVTTYQLELAPSLTCTPADVVKSDTAQIRRCAPPDSPVLEYEGPAFNEIDVEGLPSRGVQLAWFYHPLTAANEPPAAADFQPLRIDFPPEDIAAKDGLSWKVYFSAAIRPPKAGWYAARATNSCGSSPLSNRILVSRACRFGLNTRAGTERFYRSNAGHPVNVSVAPGSAVRLEVRPRFDAVDPIPLTYMWSVDDPAVTLTLSRDGRWVTTSQLTAPITVKVNVNDEQYGLCPLEVTFNVSLSTAPACEAIRVEAGLCSAPVREPVIRLPRNTQFTIKADVTINDASANPSDFWFELRRAGDSAARPRQLGNPNLPYTVLAFPERLDVTVERNGCIDTTSVYIEPLPSACDSDCALSCPTRAVPSVLVNGLSAPVYSFTPGESATLSSSEEGAGYVYSWHFQPEGGTVQILSQGNSPSILVTLVEPGQYWVVINDDGEVFESNRLVTKLGLTGSVIVTPTNQALPANSGAIYTATFTGANGSTAYQWMRGDSYQLASPIPGATSDTLVLQNVQADEVFWVRVSHEGEELRSGFATLYVTCTETVGGIINTATANLRRGQHPRLAAIGNGKQLNYAWYRRLPNETANTLIGGGPVIWPQVTAPVTTFGADVTDACGTTGSLTETTFHLCIPTIDQQPQDVVVRAGDPGTLTLGTTPAVDGQPLTITWYQAYDLYNTNPLGTGPSLMMTLPTGATSERFRAEVSYQCGSGPGPVLHSQSATIDVCAAPVITSQSGTVWSTNPGAPATATVVATGTGLTYQWYAGEPGITSMPLIGQTSNHLSVTPTTSSRYWCRITSRGVCITDSAAVDVKVCSPATITSPPQHTRIFSNATATLGVAADGGTNTEPLSYQWERLDANNNWIAIAGAVAAAYTTPPLTAEATYRVEVRTGVCSIPSHPATVSICTYPGHVAASPAETKIQYGGTATLPVPVLSPVLSKYMRWYRGPVGDRTNLVHSGWNAAYTTPALTATTQYWAEIEADGCTSETTAYTVTVCAPTITTQPVGGTIVQGTSTTLTAVTTPIGGQIFQWYAGASGNTSAPVPNGQGATVTVTPSAATQYWVRVQSCGIAVDSAVATITVCVAPGVTVPVPSHQIVAESSATIAVSPTGSNLTYQWYVGTTGTTADPIAGAQSSSLNVSPATTTSYWCRVASSGLCSTNSSTITVDVCTNPSITTQPASQRIFSAQPTTLSVTATSTRPLTYQWYIGEPGVTATPIAGATGPTLSVSPSVETSYWVRITTGACTVDSAAAVVSICTYQQVVTASPAQSNIASGGTVTLPVPILSPVMSKYMRWYRGPVGDRTHLVGAGTNASYTTPPLTASTQYWAEIDADGCTSHTTAYTVSVCVPTFTIQPQSVVIQSGNQHTLTVTATGAPLTYQWYQGASGNTSTPVGTGSSFTTPALAATTSYWVRVTGCSSVNSTTATVTVCAAPAITSLTKNSGETIGGTGTVTVVASGANLSYQWYRGQSGDTSQPISGATAATYSFTRQNSQYYWVRVTTACNNTSVDSAAILYSVNPQITQQPASVSIPSGSTTTLSVQASGTYLTYQWYSDASPNPISGATAATYTTPPLTSQRSYWCRVTSGSTGIAFTNYATISICQGPEGFLSSSYHGSNSWSLIVNMDPENLGNVKYHWYRGVPGNVQQSVDLGEGNYYKTFTNVTQSATCWVRIWWLDDSCYGDTAGHSLPPG